MSGLTSSEIMKIVNRYIGVSNGYLGDFTYKTHAEFYSEYCDLDIDPYQYEGTTRERFITILKESKPEIQAKILRGVIDKFPITAESSPGRDKVLQDELMAVVRRLESGSSVSSPSLKITTDVVERALKDAESLLKENGAISGVDRIHTALHGYLKGVCNDAGINYPDKAPIEDLFSLLRNNHPNLQNLGARQGDITKILRGFAKVIDALNTIRNEASMAHPNDNLLDQDEARLVINAVRTILHYLDAKFSNETQPHF